MNEQPPTKKKIEFLHCRISQETKKKLRKKMLEISCENLTEFLEKIADNTIVVIDKNVENLLSSLAFVPHSSVSVLTKQI